MKPSPTLPSVSLVLTITAALSFPSSLAAQAPITVSRTEDGASPTWSLELDPALGESWQEVLVGRLAVRTPELQRRLPIGKETSARVELGRTETGCALLLADLGPAHLKGRPDAWSQTTHSAKVVSCAGEREPGAALADRRAAGVSLMAKVGSRIEIRPIANPALLRPGADLPVLVYVQGTPRPHVEIEAIGPDRVRRSVLTDAAGAATISIDVSGPWTIVHRHVRDEQDDLVGTLSFTVESPTYWRKLGVEVGR